MVIVEEKRETSVLSEAVSGLQKMAVVHEVDRMMGIMENTFEKKFKLSGVSSWDALVAFYGIFLRRVGVRLTEIRALTPSVQIKPSMDKPTLEALNSGDHLLKVAQSLNII
jgi:hypothetical protein